MPECVCQRTGKIAKLQEMPCGEHMIVVRDQSGGWTAAEDDGATLGRFTVWAREVDYVLEDHDNGDARLRFRSLTDALTKICNLCDDEHAPCRHPSIKKG